MTTTVLRTSPFLRYRKPLMWLIGIAAVLLIVAFFRRGGGDAPTKTTYEFGKAEIGDVRLTVTATGVIQPWKTVDIKSNVSGRIDKLAVDLGDRVTQGQLIALIDPTDSQVAFDQASADLAAARAKRAQAEASAAQEIIQSRARIAAAQRAVESARARLAQANTNMRVQPKLTDAAINQARASLASAQQSAKQARQSVAQLQEQLNQLKEVTLPLNVATVQSGVEEAQANVDAAQSDYNRQNQLLKQGYVAKSDVETATAKLASVQAALRNAKQRQQTLTRENQLQINELSSRIDQARSAIAESDARVRQAQAALQLARDNRYQDDVRRQDRIAAQAAVQQALAELASAKAQSNQITVRQKDIQSAQTQIVRGDATVKQASTNLGYTRITSPRSGVVITKNVEEGTVVPSSRGSIGSTNALLQIGDTSRLWVVCLVDETDISQVHVGQRVDVKVDAYPNDPVEGKVIRVDPQAKLDQNVTMVPVTVELKRTDARFKPAMNAECDFVVAEARHVLMVPNEAIREENGKVNVQQLVADKPKNTPVTTGVTGQDNTQIKSGLRPGEQVITKIIEPEAAQVNNPFGGPFGNRRPGGNSRGGAGGTKAGAGGGGRPGGSGGGGATKGGR